MKILRSLKKGSFTVEAACVIPIILLALFGVIYLSVFVHDRAWLSSAACESAVCGSIEGIRRNGQVNTAAEMRCRDLSGSGLLFLEGLRESVITGERIKVRYDAELHGLFGFDWKLSSGAEAGLFEPSDRIRSRLVQSGG